MPSRQRPPEDPFKKYRSAYNAPKPSRSRVTPSHKREHHGCLILWLAGYVVFSLVAVIQLSSNFSTLSRAIPSFGLLLLLGVGIVELVCALGIFQWKRLAVYGLLAVVTVSLCLRTFIGFARPESILSIIFAYVMIYLFVRPNWEYYT